MPDKKQDVTSVTETLLEMITGAQDLVVAAQEEFAKAVTGLMPPIPEVPSAGTADLPDMKELREENFAFQTKLLEANRAFSIALIEAWSNAASDSETAKKKK